MLGEIRVGAKQVNDKRKRTLHPNGHMSWLIETRLGPNTHTMTMISTWWAIIGGIEVKADSRSTCILLMADIIKLSNRELIMTKKASLSIRKITKVWQVVIAWRSVAGVMDLAPHRHDFDLRID